MAHRLISSTIAFAFLTITFGGAFAAGATTQESPDQWRASKLAGVSIYGPNNRSVGKITDMIMTKDGRAQYVIIGVGGFLGMGEKDVAVPYDQVKFTDQPMTPPANPDPANTMATPAMNNNMASAAGTGASNAMVAGTASNGGVAAGTAGLKTQSDTMGTAAVPAMAGSMGTSNSMAGGMTHMSYPDHGTIDMTVDQLKSAPAFKFSS